MEGKECTLLWLIVGIFTLAIVICRCVYGKSKGRSVFKGNILMILVYITAFIMFNAMVVFDKSGIMYEIENFYDEAFFYTENGESFRIKDNYLICEEDNNLKYEEDICFINKDGYLVFDRNKTFEVSKFTEVYFNGNEKVYPVHSCCWNMWGDLVVPEYGGIYIQNEFFYFDNGIYERTIDVNIQEWLLISIVVMFWIPVIISFLLILIYFGLESYVTYLYAKKRKNTILKIEVLCKKYFSRWTVTAFISFEILLIEGFLTSLNSIAVFLILYGLAVWVVIPFFQGAMELENEAFERATLKQLKKCSDSKEVRKYRIAYVVGILYMIICIILRIILCS